MTGIRIMKHISTFKLFESSEINDIPDLNNMILVDFIDSFEKELESIGFYLTIEDGYMEINNLNDPPNNTGGAYIDFCLADFSTEKLKKTCNDILDKDKLAWKCNNVIKDEYDLLCTTILVFIDE